MREPTLALCQTTTGSTCPGMSMSTLWVGDIHFETPTLSFVVSLKHKLIWRLIRIMHVNKNEFSVSEPPKIDKFEFSDRKVGDRVSVSCVVISGDLPMNITWFKENRIIKRVAPGIRIHVRASAKRTRRFLLVNTRLCDNSAWETISWQHICWYRVFWFWPSGNGSILQYAVHWKRVTPAHGELHLHSVQQGRGCGSFCVPACLRYRIPSSVLVPLCLTRSQEPHDSWMLCQLSRFIQWHNVLNFSASAMGGGAPE